MEKMNYINKDKNYMTDEERIRYLEESIRELRIEKDRIRKEKGELKARLEEENKNLNIKVASFEGEIKGLNYTIEKLKEENQYRESIADVLPEGEGHIAEESIQDLQERINGLVWFEKEYHRLRDRIKKLERVLEHEYNRKIPY